MPSFHVPDLVHINGVGGRRSSFRNGVMPLTESSAQLVMNGHPLDGHTPTSEDGFLSDAEPSRDLDVDAVRFRKPGACEARSSLEKCLAVLLLLCLCALILLLVLYACSLRRLDADLSYARTASGEKVEVCTSTGCARSAANLLSAIDQNVDPCTNFYEYACGQWNRDHPIPDDMPGYGTFANVRERVRQQMRVLLESPNEPESTARSIKMAKLAYHGCMDTQSLDALNSSLLRSAMLSLSPWPLIYGDEKPWQESDFELTELLGRTRRSYGNEVFFQLYVYADAKNTTSNILYIDQGMLALGRGSSDYYLNDTMFGPQMSAYLDYMRRVVTAIAEDALHDGHIPEMRNMTQDLEDMLQFEKDFAKIIVPETERRNHTRLYNRHVVGDLIEMAPYVDWMRYFEMIVPPEANATIDKDTAVIVTEPLFLNKLGVLLEKTNKRTLTNYFIWRAAQPWSKLLDSRFDDIKQDFLRIMTGQQQKSARWKECVPGPVTYTPLAAGSMYVRRHFDSTDKKEALLMIDHLAVAFSSLVSQLEWMDHNTKQHAYQKVAGMIRHIGYPDFIKDDAKLDEHYKGLTINDSDSYFELVRKVFVWTQRKEFARLNEPFDKEEFEVSPAVVNAFYSPEKNAITFPAGILQPPFFSGDYPKAINYGAIGAVIGHEITHGFDDQGSQFDMFGNLQNWWNEKSLLGFEERKQCIIKQYSSYEMPDTGMKVNGRLTQGENIADNGGVKEAYMAYRSFVDEQGKEEPRLPGMLNFTNNQIFFLSYAHFWCGHKKRAAAIQQLLTDEHSPEQFRVIGVLSNLDEFSEAYGCKRGSLLNPPKSDRSKCVVW